MIQTVIRFVTGGTVVAAVPVVARSVSPAAGAAVLLVPVVAFTSFMFLTRAEIVRVASRSLLAVPALVAFLLAAALMTSKTSLPVAAALAVAFAAWLVLTLPVAVFA